MTPSEQSDPKVASSSAKIDKRYVNYFLIQEYTPSKNCSI